MAGIGCRYPRNLSSSERLWDFVERGGNAAVPEFPADRGWDLPALTNEQRARESKTRPEAVARAVGHAMTARRPRTRYQVGLDWWTAAVAARLLPDRALDTAIRRQFSA